MNIGWVVHEGYGYDAKAEIEVLGVVAAKLYVKQRPNGGWIYTVFSGGQGEYRIGAGYLDSGTIEDAMRVASTDALGFFKVAAGNAQALLDSIPQEVTQ